MEIRNFSDLTQFVYDEYLKITENFGIQTASESMIEFVEKNVKKYTKLYSGPLYRSAKRELILREAIETMPHGFIWKIFHWDLWQKIKKLQAKENDARENFEMQKGFEKPGPITVPAELIKPTSLPQVSVIEDD